MVISEWIISPFNVEAESAKWDTILKEFIEMTFDLEANVLIFLKIGFKLMNENPEAKYPKLWTTVEPILQAFPNLSMR